MIRRLPLRLLLTLPYIALLLSLAVVVGWLSYRSADVAIDDMAVKLQVSSGERIQEATAAYLTNWQYVVAAATAPEPDRASVELPPVERALWMASGLSSVRPSYVYFSAPDGRFVGVQRPNDGPALLKLREQGGSQPRRLFSISQPADRTRSLGAENESYVALQRPWYVTAVATTGEVWSPVYLDFSTQLPMITLTLAQRNDAGELLGVYGADVPLAQIETFLRGLEIAKQGLAYIVNSDGRIVASSLPASGAAARQELPRAIDSADALLVASFQAIGRAPVNGGSGAHAAARPALLDTPQGRVLVSVSPLRHQAGLDWRVVVVLEQSVLTAGIHRNAVRTALLAGAAALAALVLGTLILRSLAGEVGALTRAAEQLSADETPEPLRTQRSDELGRLSNAFDRMVARLAASTQDVRQRNDVLQRLAGELLTAQSEERRAIARELHDEMGQQLAALRINLQVLAANCNDATLHQRLDDSLAIVQRTIGQVRSRALDLHPAILDDLGLVAALQWLCERQSQRAGVPIRLADGAALPTLPPAVALACFRIAQEAIANALHHGRPSQIDVVLAAQDDGTLEMSVADDGSGFALPDGAHSSLGLVGMRERAQQLGGTLLVQSQHNQGTRVRVRIPIAGREQDQSPSRR